MRGNITRTFFEVKATGFTMDGFNADGTPNMVAVSTNPYISARNNDLAEGKRKIKAINSKVIAQSVSVIVVNEFVMSMGINEFFANANRVKREANGRVKSI